jgi:fructosamine-3-kinase
MTVPLVSHRSIVAIAMIATASFTTTAFRVSWTRPKSTVLRMRIDGELQSEIQKKIKQSTGSEFIISRSSGGSGGGGGASVGIISDTSNPPRDYFYKMARGASGYDMLHAEFEGISDMYNTHTIKVPKPICFGSADYDNFVIFEKINFGGSSSPERMGRELAAMHRHTSPNGMYGWKMNNTIGATFQPNNWTPDWPTFWDEYRLGHMLTLAKMEGGSFAEEKELRKKVKNILSMHQCVPSLVHGDLWSGNQAYTASGEPIIYDPATYVSNTFMATQT